ncbi:MAG: hypothetical protein M1826_003708 [Phylliscum demangeonii]|nr:MAG: hypothetical protein M1826_003708 [Phylliscum demangeonii]
MPPSLLAPSTNLPPALALQVSNEAPAILNRSSLRRLLSYPLSLFTRNESPEQWSVHENIFLSCLRTKDDEAARQLLETLTARFGEHNERVMGLRGLLEEATAKDGAGLEEVLEEYNATLAEDATNTPVMKRKVALLRSMARPVEAIGTLVTLLHSSPTDVEAWAELSDLYQAQGLYPQAIFCLEEVLLISPYAWNMHARMGEVVYLSTAKEAGIGPQRSRLLVDSMRWFCRSIELCDDYLRGYYGLKLVTNELLRLEPRALEVSVYSRGSESKEHALPPPSRAEVEQINQRATAKLADIIRYHANDDRKRGAYDEAEVVAVRELLEAETARIER